MKPQDDAAKDAFWDLDEILPPRQDRRFSVDVEAVPLEVPEDPDGGRDEGEAIPPKDPAEEAAFRQKKEVRLALAREALQKKETAHQLKNARAVGDPRKNEEPVTESAESEALPAPESYEPTEGVLIRQVTLSPWQARYHFYERFRKDALRYSREGGSPCEPVPYFSFMPQYSQMRYDQRQWYYYWRSQVRAGQYPMTDYSYILLFVYEIINVPEVILPEEGVRLLAALWGAYRSRYAKLDPYLSEWLCDYCLIHRQPVPYALLAPFFPAVLENASLGEWYLDGAAEAISPEIALLMAKGSYYNWRGSRYISPENRDFFLRHMIGAFTHTMEHTRTGGAERYLRKAHMTRDAYDGALCAYDQKRRIEVEYRTCSHSVDMMNEITELIKHTENQIRSLLDIKGRFHLPGLPGDMKQLCDAYFAPMKAAKKQKNKKEKAAEPIPAYEQQYEAPSTGFSVEDAEALEQSAWQTTYLLVGDEAEDPAVPPEIPAEPEQTPETESVSAALPPLWREVLEGLLRGEGTVLTEAARRNNQMPETLAERINEAACDVIGDIVIEEDENGGFALLAEYREDVAEWIQT